MDKCILMCRAEAVALDLYPHLGEILFYKIVKLVGKKGDIELNSLELLITTLKLHDKTEHERIAQLYNTIVDLVVEYSARLNASQV